MTFLQKLQRLAASPQGKRALTEAQRLTKDPARRRQVDDLRRRLVGDGKAERTP